jgi:hypothetical protein
MSGRDLGELIVVVSIIAGSAILALSYLGAYMLGRSHGRRAERLSPEAMDQMDSSQRIASLESTIGTLNGSVERLRDAQRLLVAQQDHLSRKVGLSSDRMGLPASTTRTPS